MQTKIQSIAKKANIGQLLTVTTVLSEVLRIFPWLLLLSSISIKNWTEPPLSFLSSLIILTIVTLILRFTLPRGFHINEVRIASLSVGILLILLLLRLENSGGYSFWDVAWFDYAFNMVIPLSAGFVFGLFLVWRAIFISREELQTDDLYRNFIIGVISFIFLLFIWAITTGINANQRVFSTLVPYILGYFFTCLMGMGISNFLSLRKGMASHPKATDLFARRWLLILLGVVSCILVIGSLVASALSFNLVSWIINPLNIVAGWLATGFLYVLGYPIGYLVEGVYWVFQFIVNWLMGLFGAKPFQKVDIGELGDAAEKVQSGNMPQGILTILKWGLLITIAAVIIYFLSRAIFRYWRGSQEKGYEEINESLWSWNGFGADVKAFLKNFTDRFRRNTQHIVPPLASTITEPRFLEIREIYRGLLWESHQSGYPRARSQTPYEYQAYLETKFSDQKVQLTAITHAYVSDRYGYIQAENDEDLTLVRWWFELRSAIRTTRESLNQDKQ